MTPEALNELEQIFKGVTEEPTRLNDCSVVMNPRRFVESHLAVLRYNMNNEKYKPYYDRLVNLKQILK